MPLLTDDAICLRKLDYSQTSQLLLLFSRELGLIKVMAKGAFRRTKKGMSKFDGGVDLFDLGQAVVSHAAHKELSLLTEWGLTDGHLGLRTNLRSLMLAHFVTELTAETLAPHDPHARLFDDLLLTLGKLSGNGREQWALWYTLRVLTESGFTPELGVCAVCGRVPGEREAVAFVASESGVVCRNCFAGYPARMAIDPRLLRVAALVAAGPTERLPVLTRFQTDPLFVVLTSHIEYVLDRLLRARGFILAKPGLPSSRQYS